MCGCDPISPPDCQPVALGGARPMETSVPEMCLRNTSFVPRSKSACLGQCPGQPLTRLLAFPTSPPRQVTTDLRQRCTDGHTGTSVSAPMVAGIIALALEAK